ncbi:hypothetical protein KQI48_17040 [Cellulomonas hominis]|uniref:hypothetical protein n=1 Tax=Cellulomonas hominis TaxID=156981 RepID=UPI001C0FA9FB|nr:hypothetical protein [Cellulomonas hominis]MBU5424380.1 hypothetical protein [Cellulomonas hominis]
MTPDVRVAIAVALLLFAVLLALVTTGSLTVPPRFGTDLRVRRWRWGPVTALVAAAISTVLLSGWPSRVLGVVALVLAALALAVGPVREGRPRTAGRRAATNGDARAPRRLTLLACSLLALGTSVYLAMAASQA